MTRAPFLPSVALITLLALAFHLWLAHALPLVEDEAYYALWATVPSAGYYDHPPMIAWWIRAGEVLFGHTPLAVRLLPVLAFALATPMAARVAVLAAGDAAAGRRAALYLNAMVVVLVLGFTATPDAPSTFFWALTGWALAEATAGNRHGGWWLLAGLGAGLGVLSKFTNLFLWVGLAGWLLATRAGRAELRRPVVWAAAALALAVLVPYARWNMAHDGLGLTRQFGRIGSGEAPGWHWLLAYLGATVALVSPVILIDALAGVPRARGAAGLLLWLTAPLVLYMAVHALKAQVQANWLVPLFPGLAALAALGARDRPARHLWFAAAVGAGLGLGALGLALLPGRPLFPGQNPPNEMKGWAQVVAEVQRSLADTGAGWVATASYGLTGTLSFDLPDTPVWAINEAGRYLFRGPLPQVLCTAPGLLVTLGAPPPEVLARFTSHGAPRTIERRSGAAVLQVLTATPVQGLTPCAVTP